MVDAPFVTVVSGLPRSGTSLMMQMLAAGGLPVLADHVRPPDVDNPRGYFELERVRRIERDRGWLGSARGHAVKIVADLLPFLPGGHAYRVILMERALAEVAASQSAMLARRGADVPGPEVALLAARLAELDRWAAGRPDVSLLRVEHRGLLTDPVAAAAAVRRFLDLPLDVEAMAGAVDPRLHRQRA